MSIINIFFLFIAAIFVLTGFIAIFRHKLYLFGNTSKYTEESLLSITTLYGLSQIVLGVGFAIDIFVKEPVFEILGFQASLGAIIWVVCIVVFAVLTFMALRKLEEK